jgi:hypothetical protein
MWLILDKDLNPGHILIVNPKSGFNATKVVLRSNLGLHICENTPGLFVFH